MGPTFQHQTYASCLGIHRGRHLIGLTPTVRVCSEPHHPQSTCVNVPRYGSRPSAHDSAPCPATALPCRASTATTTTTISIPHSPLPPVPQLPTPGATGPSGKRPTMRFGAADPLGRPRAEPPSHCSKGNSWPRNTGHKTAEHTSAVQNTAAASAQPFVSLRTHSPRNTA